MADEVFVGQGYITLHLDTETSLTGATSAQVKYFKPGGVTGFWPATIVGNEVQYELTDTSIDVPGDWKFQPWVVIGGRTAKGKLASKTFKP